MRELRFTVSADSKVKAITYGTTGLLIATLLFVSGLIYAGEGASGRFYTTSLLIGLTYAILVFFAWAYSPTEYILTDRELIIKRPANNIVIPYSSINSVEKKDFLGNRMIRQMGNGGLFSFSGTFRSKEEGKMKMYVKNTNYIVINAGKKYVISPDERDEFMMMLDTRMK